MGEGEGTPLAESVKITKKNKKRDGRSAQENKQTVLEHMDRVSHATWSACSMGMHVYIQVAYEYVNVCSNGQCYNGKGVVVPGASHLDETRHVVSLRRNHLGVGWNHTPIHFCGSMAGQAAGIIDKRTCGNQVDSYPDFWTSNYSSDTNDTSVLYY